MTASGFCIPGPGAGRVLEELQGKLGDGSGLIDNWGYIDRTGKVVISRSLKQGWPFREGLALIGNGGPI